MKKTLLFILCSLFIATASPLHADTPVTGTAGSNLTSYNGASGAMNNNSWNQMMNTRTPNADFGNCNALILRCAQPRCASGGCTSMDIAYPIVSGCVMASSECKAHGDTLIQSISAQIVANSTARASAEAAAAQTASAQAAAAQSEQQIQQMQAQMQQMQNQIAQQSAASAAAVQQALDEQKQLAADQAAAAAAREAAAAAASPAANVESAAELGVSADVLAREQASGQIMTQLENAEVALSTLQKTMQNAFDYAGCDANGNNCTGPKRVRAFKQKANEFFDPYENVLDEVYDALIMAQSLGVDITDIYMMLNGSCNVWGKYMCQRCSAADFANKTHGDTKNGQYECEQNGNDYYWTVAKILASDGTWKVAPRQQYCSLTQMLSSQDEVQQNWLDMSAGSSGGIRVACASDAIENSVLFRNRKKQATIDIETLQRIIEQDAPSTFRTVDDARNATRFCSVDDDDITKLQLLTQKKALTSTGGGWGKVCVADRSNQMYPKGVYATSLTTAGGLQDCAALGKVEADGVTTAPEGQTLETAKKNASDKEIRNCEEQNARRKQNCAASGGTWEHGCRCPDNKEYRAERCLDILVASPSDTYTDSKGVVRNSATGEEASATGTAGTAVQ